MLCVWQGWTEPNSFHVCITSYKQLFRGHAAFSRVRWRCLVIDDMQRVKGLTERHWEAVFTLQRSAPRAAPPESCVDVRGPAWTAGGLRACTEFPVGCTVPSSSRSSRAGDTRVFTSAMLRARGRVGGPPLSRHRPIDRLQSRRLCPRSRRLGSLTLSLRAQPAAPAPGRCAAAQHLLGAVDHGALPRPRHLQALPALAPEGPQRREPRLLPQGGHTLAQGTCGCGSGRGGGSPVRVAPWTGNSASCSSSR